MQPEPDPHACAAKDRKIVRKKAVNFVGEKRPKLNDFGESNPERFRHSGLSATHNTHKQHTQHTHHTQHHTPPHTTTHHHTPPHTTTHHHTPPHTTTHHHTTPHTTTHTTHTTQASDSSVSVSRVSFGQNSAVAMFGGRDTAGGTGSARRRRERRLRAYLRYARMSVATALAHGDRRRQLLGERHE